MNQPNPGPSTYLELGNVRLAFVCVAYVGIWKVQFSHKIPPSTLLYSRVMV